MKISELINQLERFQNEFGDLNCDTWWYDGSRVEYRGPVISYRAKLEGREKKSRFATDFYGSEELKRRGEMVVRI